MDAEPHVAAGGPVGEEVFRTALVIAIAIVAIVAAAAAAAVDVVERCRWLAVRAPTAAVVGPREIV